MSCSTFPAHLSSKAPTETSVMSHVKSLYIISPGVNRANHHPQFKTIHRGDYEILRPFSEAIIPSAVRRPVMIQAASRKAAKRKRQFDMQLMVSEPEERQAVTTDWVSRIKGIDGERLILAKVPLRRSCRRAQDLWVYSGE